MGIVRTLDASTAMITEIQDVGLAITVRKLIQWQNIRIPLPQLTLIRWVLLQERLC